MYSFGSYLIPIGIVLYVLKDWILFIFYRKYYMNTNIINSIEEWARGVLEEYEVIKDKDDRKSR